MNSQLRNYDAWNDNFDELFSLIKSVAGDLNYTTIGIVSFDIAV